MSDNGSSSSNTSCNIRTKCYYPPKPKDLTPGRTLAVEVCMFIMVIKVLIGLHCRFFVWSQKQQ